MTGLIGLVWFFIGITIAIAGRPFLEVAVFEGCWELYLIKEELENEEDE